MEILPQSELGPVQSAVRNNEVYTTRIKNNMHSYLKNSNCCLFVEMIEMKFVCYIAMGVKKVKYNSGLLS